MHHPPSLLDHPFIHHAHLPHRLRRQQRSPLGFVLAAALEILVRKECEGAADEDESVDADAQARGIR